MQRVGAVMEETTSPRPAESDGGLLRLVREGDRDAWEELVRRYDGWLHGAARRFRLDPAACEDVVQSTWLRLIENLGAIRDPEAVGAWLMVTLRRLALSQLRSWDAEVRLDMTTLDVPDSRRSPEAEVVGNELDTLTRTAVAKLRGPDGRLLRLMLGSPKLSYEEASRALRIPVGSIGPTRTRGLRRLRRELEAAGLDRGLIVA